MLCSLHLSGGQESRVLPVAQFYPSGRPRAKIWTHMCLCEFWCLFDTYARMLTPPSILNFISSMNKHSLSTIRAAWQSKKCTSEPLLETLCIIKDVHPDPPSLCNHAVTLGSRDAPESRFPGCLLHLEPNKTLRNESAGTAGGRWPVCPPVGGGALQDPAWHETAEVNSDASWVKLENLNCCVRLNDSKVTCEILERFSRTETSVGTQKWNRCASWALHSTFPVTAP